MPWSASPPAWRWVRFDCWRQKTSCWCSATTPTPACGVAKFALHRLGDVHQSHDFERASRDFSERTRADTALLLGLLGEPSAVRILQPMLNDRSAKVRLQAAEALSSGWAISPVWSR